MRVPIVAAWLLLIPLAAPAAERDEERWVCVPTEEREWRCGRGEQAPEPAPLPPARPPKAPPPGYAGPDEARDVPYYLLDPTLPAPAEDEREASTPENAEPASGAPERREPDDGPATGAAPGPASPSKPTSAPVAETTRDERPAAVETGPARYAIQVAAAREPDSLTDYRRQLEQEGLDVHQRTWEDAGGTWHVLLAGRFATVDAANAALAELPARVRDRGAWVRPLRTLQPAAN